MKTATTARGYLTLAYGKGLYLQMAVNLARSLMVWDPAVPRAIICDTNARPLVEKYFDVIIPTSERFGKRNLQKLGIYEYSPFEETLFIDADCLVFRKPQRIWDRLSVDDFGVFGSLEKVGVWRYDFEHACKAFDVDAMPKINGGCYYFRKCEKARRLFQDANALTKQTDEIRKQLKQSFPVDTSLLGDEYHVSIAMAKNGFKPCDDRSERTMIGPIQLEVCNVRLNILKGVVRCWNSNIEYHPVLIHFFLKLNEGFHYRREVWRLKKLVDEGRNSKVIGMQAYAYFNVYYFVFTCLYALAKIIMSKPTIKVMACVRPDYFFKGQKYKFLKLLARLGHR